MKLMVRAGETATKKSAQLTRLKWLQKFRQDHTKPIPISVGSLHRKGVKCIKLFMVLTIKGHTEIALPTTGSWRDKTDAKSSKGGD